MDDVDADNERHRREEQERRAKRKAARESKSESQAEKERKRREHAQRILGQQAQKKHKPAPPSRHGRTDDRHRHKSKSKESAGTSDDGGSSLFQSLFQTRAEGFLIDLKFRNAPPRPPVGPCFVGLGLEGELRELSELGGLSGLSGLRGGVEKGRSGRSGRNSVEKSYTWKLHCETDLGVPLAVSALDYECYTDPDKANDKANKDKDKEKSSANGPHVIPPLHPDDEALIHWKGSKGDTAAEQLQQKRDRARAAARLAIAQGAGAPKLTHGRGDLGALGVGGTPSSTSAFKLKKKHHLQSRILDEKTPQFMKKTTYLTNDATSVHRFTSLAHTQEKRARDVDRAMAETKVKYSEGEMIERGFVEGGRWEIITVGASSSNASGNKRRKHPTKKNVHPVWDLPLLPDVNTWGHTYTHVVLDNPPKSVKQQNAAGKATPTKDKDKKSSNNLVTGQQLHEAIVADVTRQTQNDRMACTVWVPSTEDSTAVTDSDSDKPKPKKAKTEKGSAYQAVQRYDLDVVPLRDATGPPIHYVLMIDPTKNYVGYHPVGSRVQLSTGRPVVLSDDGQTKKVGNKNDESAKMATDRGIVTRRMMELDEKTDMEKRMAEVDVDLAEKYGLVEEGGGGGGGKKKKKGGSGKGSGGSANEDKRESSSSGQKKRTIKDDSDDDDDDEMEEDAF